MGFSSRGPCDGGIKVHKAGLPRRRALPGEIPEIDGILALLVGLSSPLVINK